MRQSVFVDMFVCLVVMGMMDDMMMMMIMIIDG